MGDLEKVFKTHCLENGDANNSGRYTYVLTITMALYHRFGKPIILLPNGYIENSSEQLTESFAYRLCYDRPISKAAVYEFNNSYQRLYSTNKPTDMMALNKAFPELASLSIPPCR